MGINRNRKEYQAQYYREHRSDLLLRSRWWKLNHLEYQRNRTIAIKKEVLTHYGNGKCACVMCGEERLLCLSLDHINNNGSDERKQIWGKNNGGGGVRIYRLLQKGIYPEGYQTLCMNCQWIKELSHREKGIY